MRLFVETDGVQKAVQLVRAAASNLKGSRNLGVASSLRSFSTVGGLDTAGDTLGGISDERAPEATEALAIYLTGIAESLQRALDNTMGTDESLARFIASRGDSLGARALANSDALAHLGSALKPVDPKTNSFATPTAMAGSESSINSLDGKLGSTDQNLALDASRFWESNATLIQNAVEELEQAQHALSSSSETLWVANAMETIAQVQRAGLEYAANSQALTGHTASLAATVTQEQLLTSAAAATYNTIEDPKEKAAFESAFLSSFSSRLTSNLVPTTPQFNRLLPDPKALPGDPFAIPALSAPAPVDYEPAPLPKPVREALTQNGFGDLAHATTPAEVVQQFGHPDRDMLKTIAAGDTRTHAASAVLAPPAPSAAAPVGSGGAGLGAAPVSVAPSWANPAGTAVAAGVPGATPARAGGGGSALSPVPGMGAGMGPGTGGAAGGASRHAAPGISGGMAPGHHTASGRGGQTHGEARGLNGRAGGTQLPGSAHQLAGTHPGGPSSRSGSGLGAGSSFARSGGSAGFAGSPGSHGAGNTGMSTGFHAGAGSPAAGGPGSAGGLSGAHGGAGSGFGHPGHGAAGAANSHSAGSAYGNQSGANAHRPGVVAAGPMAGASRQQRNDGGKPSKVKTVTSAVERDGNLRALLGEAPLTLPNVIGFNVRG